MIESTWADTTESARGELQGKTHPGRASHEFHKAYFMNTSHITGSLPYPPREQNLDPLSLLISSEP